MTATEIYTENKSGRIINSFIRSIRKGTIAEVYESYCLAPGRGRADKRRRILAERLKAIMERGGKIREAATGRVSGAYMPDMLMQAYEQIATSGRARKRKMEGRPAVEWSNHEIEVMETVWQSRRYKNDDERLTAIRKRLGRAPGRTWLRVRFGSPHKRDE